VFDHFANIYHSFPGRITADLFKKQITTVVDIWEDWIVFPPDFTAQLRERLEGNVITTEEAPKVEAATAISKQPLSKFKTSTFQPATKPVEDVPPAAAVSKANSDDGEPMDVSTDGEDDLDGQPAEDIDVDGEPVEDLDGEPAEDLDGEPVVDDVDGVAIDEDLDGELIEDEDLDGQPVQDEDLDGEPVQDDDLDGEPVS